MTPPPHSATSAKQPVQETTSDRSPTPYIHPSALRLGELILRMGIRSRLSYLARPGFHDGKGEAAADGAVVAPRSGVRRHPLMTITSSITYRRLICPQCFSFFGCRSMGGRWSWRNRCGGRGGPGGSSSWSQS